VTGKGALLRVGVKLEGEGKRVLTSRGGVFRAPKEYVTLGKEGPQGEEKGSFVAGPQVGLKPLLHCLSFGERLLEEGRKCRSGKYSLKNGARKNCSFNKE